MAEPIRDYTPQLNVREQLRRKVEEAPLEHAEALLAAYRLLQEAQDHGVLDILRGVVGSREFAIGKGAEYANTPEGIRAFRNLLAIARLLGDIDPEILDAIRNTLHENRKIRAKSNSRPPNFRQILRRFASDNSRRTLAAIAEISESLGGALRSGRARSQDDRSDRCASGVAVPVILSAVVVMIAGFWIGRRSPSSSSN